MNKPLAFIKMKKVYDSSMRLLLLVALFFPHENATAEVAKCPFQMYRAIGRLFTGPAAIPEGFKRVGSRELLRVWSDANGDVQKAYDLLRARFGDYLLIDVPGLERTLVVHDRAAMVGALSDSGENYDKSYAQWRMIRGIADIPNLLTATGDTWARQNEAFGRLFNANALAEANFIDRADSVARPRLERLASSSSRPNPVNVDEFTRELTLDVFTRTVFGVQLSAERVRALSDAFLQADHLMGLELLNPMRAGLHELPALSRAQREGRAAINLIRDESRLILEEVRKLSPSERSPLFRQLFSYRHENGSPLSESELIQHIGLFIIAGYDSTAATLSVAIQAVANDPALARALRAELDPIFRSGAPITANAISDRAVPTLTAALNESLRLATPGHTYVRQAVRPASLVLQDGRRIPIEQGTHLVFPARAINHDERVWGRDHTGFLAGAFNHQRFMRENLRQRGITGVDTNSLAFGYGSRICVGRMLATTEIKLLLGRIIAQYDVAQVSGAPGLSSSAGSVIRRTGTDVHLAFHPRARQ